MSAVDPNARIYLQKIASTIQEQLKQATGQIRLFTLVVTVDDTDMFVSNSSGPLTDCRNGIPIESFKMGKLDGDD